MNRTKDNWMHLVKDNSELVLSTLTLIALLVGWLGGPGMTGLLPGWAVGLAAVLAYVSGGVGGVKEILADLKHRALNIELLMLLSALGAASIGEWEEGALLLFLFSLSGALETFALDRTRHAIELLSDLYPDTAVRKRNGIEETVSVNSLTLNDIVLVRPGGRFPADGQVMKGESTADQSPITGESIPVSKSFGDPVFAGSINGSGALEIKVSKPTSESTLSKVIQLIEQARQAPAPAQRLFDRFSQPYTVLVLIATGLTVLIPWAFVNEPFAATLYRAMTLMVVASPCALIISTPASILSAIGAAARYGVLLKGGAYLDKTAEIDVIAFDKTGTLTFGKPEVVEVRPLQHYTQNDILTVAASAELLSEHPIGQSVVRKARSLALTTETPDDFHAVSGHGIRACFERDDHTEVVFIGNEKLFLSEHIEFSPAVRLIGQSLQQSGKTTMLVARSTKGRKDLFGNMIEWEPMGYIAVADTVRPEAREVMDALQQLHGQRVVMLTGDNSNVAKNIAEQLNIHDVRSELLPEQKVAQVQRLSQNNQLMMVGDGINDAPALAAASVGVAMGAAGTDVALETADVVLMNDDLSRLPFFLHLSHKAVVIVRQNIVFSVGVILTLIASTLLLPAIIPGFVLPLPLGVIGHEGSTLVVVFNGLRLLLLKPNKL